MIPPKRWARMARTRCSDCRASIIWTTAVDLPWRVPFGKSPEGQEERRRLWEAINWCGPDAEAWWCDSCAAWGVFSDMERMLG